MSEWYYSKMNLQHGPVALDELREKVLRGEIGEENLIWREGMADWLPVSQVAEFQAKPQVAAIETGGIPPLPLPQPSPYQGDPTVAQIPSFLWQSVVALALSCVLAFMICIPLGLPFGIVALIYATKVDGLKVQGRGMEAASASGSAKIWMILSFCMSALPLLGVLGLIAWSVFTGI